MKKILILLVSFLIISSCSDAEKEIYNGESYVNFNKGTSGKALVLSTETAPYVEYNISYGTVKAVEGNHQVKLVVDSSNPATTAVKGVDYDIVNETDELTTGEVGGTFKIKVYKAPVTLAGKTVVFKLQSSTLQLANFDQTYTLGLALTCPADAFVGDFSVSSGFFTGSWISTIEEGTAPNTLVIKDAYADGYDLTFTYDKSTGVLTFSPQQTGYLHPSYGMVSIKPATNGSVSTVDFCNRKLIIKANWYVSAGTFGDLTDTYTGL